MRIGRQQSAQTPVFKQNLGRFGVLVLVFVIGLLAGNQGWSRVIRDLRLVPAWISRSVLPVEDLPTLVVDMDFGSYDDILNQREQALQTGVYIPSNRDFVTATLRLDSFLVPVEMRLLTGLADNLGDDEKWGFEVRTRSGHRLLDMQRFYLLDPSVNNWLDQWAFARALECEGILVARYQFVHLIWNGADRGIYALQEGVADELLAAQGRTKGVIVKFDADLLWASSAHFQGDARAAYADPITNLSSTDFQYLEVDTFRDAVVTRDPNLSAQKDNAIGLLRALQAGKLLASEVFDVERYGRFLALVDLWGATRGASLVNLHYYYNPTFARLEPVAFNANALGSDARLSLSATYADPVLQAAYVQQALRVSQPAYLDQLQTQLEPEFRRLQRALGREKFAPPWDELRERQEQIRRSLDPLQPVFAYLGSPTLTMSGTLRVDVGNVLNLPVEVTGFDINGATFLAAERRWLQGESFAFLTADADRVILRALDTARAPVVRYVSFDIPLTEIQRLDNELDFMQELEINVVTRIPGLSATRMTLARHGYPDILVVPIQE